MLKFSSKVEKCELSPVRKFNPCAAEARAKGRNIYHLNIGQPDVKTPEIFFQAVSEFREPVLAYAPAPGMPVLLEAIKEYFEKIDIKVGTDEMLITTGGGEALDIVMACILDDDDELLVPEPFYANYNTFARVTGGKIRPIPTTAESGYRYADRSIIEPLINEHTRGIMITNPGNPTGVVLTDEEMRVMVDIAKEHDLFLIGDEVYREYAYDRQAKSLLTFEDAAENIIVLDSVSKRFSACGARIGAIITHNKEFIKQALKLCQGRLCSPTLEQVGSAALYRAATPEYYASVREEYQRRRDTVVEAFSKIPGAKFRCPDGAFYMMITLPVDDTEKLQYFLLEEFEDNGDTVMYAPGCGFYADSSMGRDEIRIAYVKECDYLVRAIELLGKGIEAYNAKNK